MKQIDISQGTSRVEVYDLSSPENEIEYIVTADAQLTVVVTAYGDENAEGKAIVRLAEPGASASILGLLVNTGQQAVSLHTVQLHAAPRTTSNLLVRSVLKDDAVFTYDGAIRVEPKAQRTDAYQRNENLLLSDTAKAISRPSLEILANDVRCTHGATMGTLDPDQLFYLASRGVAGEMAKQLIVDGFFESALQQIPDKVVAERVKQSLWRNL